MADSSKKLLWDITAAALSVSFFEFFVENASFNPYINWNRIIFSFLAGISSYSIMLFLFRNKQKFIRIPMVVYSIVFGSILWVSCHLIYVIYFDWQYSEMRGGTFTERYLDPVKYSFFYIVPLLSINAFIFLGLLRILKKAVLFTRSAKLP